MIGYVAAVVTANLVVLVVHTVRKERANRRILAHLRRAEERERQMWDVLLVIKEYRESGRVHHKEAAVAKDELGRQVAEATGELKHEIEQVPGKVAEAIKGDSGVMKKG